jgi:ketosteroid isomerase-like protein
MTNETEDLVRRAFEAFAGGDVDGVLELVDPAFEWTFLDPSVEEPEPQVCLGRDELAYFVGRPSRSGAPFELEEMLGFGDRVLVVTRAAGLDATRARKTGDRNFHVVTVREGRVAALRACRTRDEAVEIAAAR